MPIGGSSSGSSPPVPDNENGVMVSRACPVEREANFAGSLRG